MIRTGRYVPTNGKPTRVVVDTDMRTFVTYYPERFPALRLYELPIEFMTWTIKTGAVWSE